MIVTENSFSVIEELTADNKGARVTIAKKPTYCFICENSEDQSAVHAFIAICLRDKVKTK